MDTVLHRAEGPADAELISAVRGGDLDAYGELFGRHVAAARRLARQLVSPSDAEDLVSEAFAKVLSLLQRGSGPDVAFRAYLLTAVRRLHVDRIRASSRVHTTDDLESFDPGVPFRDTAVEGFENAAAAKAFASLPERWQAVLWHTEVENQKPAEVAVLLGMSANSVSALAYRAREGLRQAFLTMHLQELEEDACAWTHQNLGAYVRHGMSRRDAAKLEQHLSECRRCTALYLELTEVNSNLSGLLAPLLLGGVAAAYVGSAAGVAALKGGLVALVDGARDFVAAHVPASAAAGVAAALVVGGGLFAVIDDDESQPMTSAPAADRDRADRNPAGRGQSRRDREAAPQRRSEGPRQAVFTGPPPTAATAAQVSLPAPPPGPGPAPGQTEPDPDGGPAPQGPGPPPDEGPPEQPPNEEPAPDLRISARATSTHGLVHRVVVSVAGLAPDGTATLTVVRRGVVVVLTRDDRCPSPHPESCRVDRTPATFEFTATTVPQAEAALVFTVVPGAGTADADRTNNRATVPLGS